MAARGGGIGSLWGASDHSEVENVGSGRVEGDFTGEAGSVGKEMEESLRELTSIVSYATPPAHSRRTRDETQERTVVVQATFSEGQESLLSVAGGS
jgi:hypothetical protein